MKIKLYNFLYSQFKNDQSIVISFWDVLRVLKYLYPLVFIILYLAYFLFPSKYKAMV